MSEEIALAAGDIAYWRGVAEHEATWRKALETALRELQGATIPEPNGSPHEDVWNRSRITLHTRYYYGPAGFAIPPIELCPDEVSETQVLDDMARRLAQAEADAGEFRRALAVAMQQIDAEHDLTKSLLIKMRRYFVSHELQTGECVAWMHLKRRYHIGENTDADAQWLRDYEQQKASKE